MSQLGAFTIPFIGTFASRQEVIDALQAMAEYKFRYLPQQRAIASRISQDARAPRDFARDYMRTITEAGAAVAEADEAVDAATAEARRRGWLDAEGNATMAGEEQVGSTRGLLSGGIAVGTALLVVALVAVVLLTMSGPLRAIFESMAKAKQANMATAQITQAAEAGQPWAQSALADIAGSVQTAGEGGGAVAFSGGMLVAVAVLAGLFFAFGRR